LIKFQVASILSAVAVIATTPSVVFAGQNSRTLDGGTVNIACVNVPVRRKTTVLWKLTVSNPTRPISFVNLTITLSDGQTRSVIQPRPGQIEATGVEQFLTASNIPITATIEGIAAGLNSESVYRYTITPALAVTCD
jgi:hypothetical protein